MIYNRNRAWIELSSDAFFYNVMQLKRVVGAAYIAAVLKANAYGHGLVEMGLLCDQAKHVQFMCVAFLSEALVLRQAGVVKPIIILSYADAAIEESIDKNIAFVVDEYEQVYALHAMAQKYHTTFDVHIKVDTGLTRRGINGAQVIPFISLVQQLPHIRIVGICSHFASAYDVDSSRACNQINLFSLVIHDLMNHDIQIPLVHMSNSSCTVVAGCNVYRTGIGLYGYAPKSLGIPLKPVLSFKTRIVQIKEVPADVLVGYDGTYRTIRHTTLAFLPIGYSDGYDARFANVGVMYLRGNYAPVCGRVAMNMTTIDVTDIPGVVVGDEVMVIGDVDSIRAFDLCEQSGIRNIRDLLTGINPLLPRIVL